MESRINVRKVTSKDLLQYVKQREEQNADWNDIAWEENKLESGPGTPDCETHLKIVSTYTAWNELFYAQRKSTEETMWHTCDVHLIAMGGYIPCHLPFLMHKSDFLDMLIKDNMKVNMPYLKGKSVITITLMDVQLVHLKLVMTLLYTGSCLVADQDEEEAVKATLRMLEIIDKGTVKCVRETVDQAALKSKKKKWKTVKVQRFADDTTTSPSSAKPSADNNTGPSCSNAAAGSPGGSKRHTTPIAGSSGGSAAIGVLSEPLELKKTNPGDLIPKKPAERIHRQVLNEPSMASSSSNSKRAKGPLPMPVDSDDDESDPLSAPIPPVQKVAPGSLLPRQQAPRIIRDGNTPRKAEVKGNGKRVAGKSKPTSTTSSSAVATAAKTVTNNIEDDEDNDSNEPAIRTGRYEQDDEYIPPGADISAAIEEADDDVGVIDDIDEDELLESDDEEERRPRTRASRSVKAKGSPKGRYALRKRRQGKPNEKEKTEKESEKCEDEDSDKPITPEVPFVSPRATRTSGKSKDSGSPNGSSRSSSLNADTENKGHRCSYCGDTYMDIMDLKNHLESSCAKLISTTYDLVKKQCRTCQTFFISYNAYDFMEHVKICVCSAKPKQTRRRQTSAASASSNQSAGSPPVQTPEISPLKPDSPAKSPQPTVKQEVEQMQTSTLDVWDLRKVAVILDKLNSQDISKIQERVRLGTYNLETRPNPPPRSYRYAYRKDPDSSVLISCTLTQPPIDLASCSPPIRPVHPKRSSEVSNDTFPTASSSTFDPTFVSTPVSTRRSSTTSITNKIKKTGTSTRPAPLSVKRKAMAMADSMEKEKHGDANKDEFVKKPRQIFDKQKESSESASAGKSGSSSTMVAPTTAGLVSDQKTTNVMTTAMSLKEKLRAKGTASKEPQFTPDNSSAIQEVVTIMDTPEKQTPSTSSSRKEGLNQATSDNVEMFSNSSDINAPDIATQKKGQLPKPGASGHTLVEQIIRENLTSNEKAETRTSRKPSNDQPMAQSGKQQVQERIVTTSTNTSNYMTSTSTQRSGQTAIVTLMPSTSYSAVLGQGVAKKSPAPQQLPLTSTPIMSGSVPPPGIPTKQAAGHVLQSASQSGTSQNQQIGHPMQQLPSTSTPIMSGSVPPGIPTKQAAGHVLQSASQSGTSQNQQIGHPMQQLPSTSTPMTPGSVPSRITAQQTAGQVLQPGAQCRTLQNQQIAHPMQQNPLTSTAMTSGHAPSGITTQQTAGHVLPSASHNRTSQIQQIGHPIQQLPLTSTPMASGSVPSGITTQQTQSQMLPFASQSRTLQNQPIRHPIQQLPLTSTPMASGNLSSGIATQQTAGQMLQPSTQSRTSPYQQIGRPMQQYSLTSTAMISGNVPPGITTQQAAGQVLQSGAQCRTLQNQQIGHGMHQLPLTSTAMMSGNVSSGITTQQTQSQVLQFASQSHTSQYQQIGHPIQQTSFQSVQQPSAIVGHSAQTQSRHVAEGVHYNRSSPISHNIPSVGRIQSVGSLANIPSIATVHLPVTGQYNPLAATRSVQVMAQQSQMLIIQNSIPIPTQIGGSSIGGHAVAMSNSTPTPSLPSSNEAATIAGSTVPVDAPASNPTSAVSQNSTVASTNPIETKPTIFVGPRGKVFHEQSSVSYKCPDCGIDFGEKEHFLDHQANGMCI